jgi:hypothetical protein
MFKLPCKIAEVKDWRPSEEFRLALIRERETITRDLPRKRTVTKVPASLVKIAESLDGEKRAELEKLLGRKL